LRGTSSCVSRAPQNIDSTMVPPPIPPTRPQAKVWGPRVEETVLNYSVNEIGDDIFKTKQWTVLHRTIQKFNAENPNMQMNTRTTYRWAAHFRIYGEALTITARRNKHLKATVRRDSFGHAWTSAITRALKIVVDREPCTRWISQQPTTTVDGFILISIDGGGEGE